MRRAGPTSSCTLAGRRDRRLRRFCVGAPSWRMRLGEACTTSFILSSQRASRARSESVSASQMGSAGFSWVRLSGGWAAGTQQAPVRRQDRRRSPEQEPLVAGLGCRHSSASRQSYLQR